MADVPIPKLPDTKRLEFLAFMIWVALIGAVLILLIDYQIKSAILQASDRAWRGIDGLKTSQRGSSHSANPFGDNTGGVLNSHGTEMETRIVVEGVSDPTAEIGSGQSANGTRPVRKPRAGNTRIPPTNKPVES
jgi:hypothetical protein